MVDELFNWGNETLEQRRLREKFEFELLMEAAAKSSSTSASAVGGSSALGKYSKYSMYFAGNGSNFVVDTGEDDLFDITDGLTLSAWVKPDTIIPSTDIGIIDKLTSNPTNGGYAIYHDNVAGTTGHWSCRIRKSGGSLATVSSPQITSTDWTHVCGVFDGGVGNSGDLILYINGINVDNTSTAPDETINTNSSDLVIGAETTGGADSFLGNIDDPSVFNIAFTGPQVLELFNQGGPGKPGDLSTHSAAANGVGWWKFDDATFGGGSWTIINEFNPGVGDGTSLNITENDRHEDTP